MILDTSAIIAIFQDEPECQTFLGAIENAETIKIASTTILETSMVMISRYGEKGMQWLHDFLAIINAEEIPFSFEHRRCAESAFVTYGKGQNSKSQLNMGDCFSYALAKVMDVPLLFKGDDFIHTDIERVIL